MAEETEVRLVVCPTCKQIEEIPDFQGPVEYDTLLDVVASRHEYDYDKPHPGLRMFRVKSTDWNNPRVRQEIIVRIKDETSTPGLGDTFYTVKETFKEDAMKCWKQHNRRRNCEDFKSDRKRLMPDTTKERKAIGVGPMQSNRYLCEFCPVHAVMMQRMRAARGDYDYSL